MPEADTSRDRPISKIRVSFDARVFSCEAVKNAAYRFLDRFTADIEFASDAWHCEISFVRPLSRASADDLIRDFRSEVLDHDLRLAIGKKTESVRNLVLALAFSKTGLQEDEQV